MPSTRDRERIAVVGSGVAGLTAAYLLQRRYDVTLYEADDRLGGHAHTHDVITPDAGVVPVDSGFIVHNQRTYPSLLRLFGELGVTTQPTEMSMSIRCAGCGLEYAGAKGLRGLFAQARSMSRPAYLRMLGEVKRFHLRAHALLTSGDDTTTLGQFLAEGRFSSYFTQHFMIPLVSCVWSSSAQTAASYPARYLFAFLDNHGMLSVTGSPQWRTVTGGSRTYVERAVKELSTVQLATPVRGIRRTAGEVEVRDDADDVQRFHGVVVATHADTALSLLEDPTDDERDVLGAFPYTRNETVLHHDRSMLPRSRGAQASWNYFMPSCGADAGRVVVTYDMNRLQALPTTTPCLVTLNAAADVDPALVEARMDYAHPIYTPESVAAQRRLPALTSGRTAYAGAHHGWGFHEDGCASGVRAAAAFGVEW